MDKEKLNKAFNFLEQLNDENKEESRTENKSTNQYQQIDNQIQDNKQLQQLFLFIFIIFLSIKRYYPDRLHYLKNMLKSSDPNTFSTGIILIYGFFAALINYGVIINEISENISDNINTIEYE